MKNFIIAIFDFIFPRRPNDTIIAGFTPTDFYEHAPRWSNREIYPEMRAIFHYKDPMVKAMVKEFKSSRNEHAAKIAAYALANLLRESGIASAVIIPMPISKKRRKKRGYNQCEFLADIFMKEIRARNQVGRFEIRTDILEKTVDTSKLAFQNRASRLMANEGAFKAHCPFLSIEKRIIVIDDVITTGSTMHSAMETLRQAGARDVFGIGIAH